MIVCRICFSYQPKKVLHRGFVGFVPSAQGVRLVVALAEGASTLGHLDKVLLAVEMS